MTDLLVATVPYLMVGAVALLIGAGLGYYTAQKDIEQKGTRNVE